MNPENINDPAGKFNMNDSIFKKESGVHTLLAKCQSTENTVYSSYDKRAPDAYTPGPDFFSRFDVTLSEIKVISNMCGLIKTFGVELSIQSKEDNFLYSGISKASNSNAVVRNELSKLYTKHGSATPAVKNDLELLMAAEAAKKGGGDDLQLLSHWHVYHRFYEIADPARKRTESNQQFVRKENPIFFVSHDGPTIVRALIEGNNVLFMYSQVIGGAKFECAVSLIRGKFVQPPLFETLKKKYANLPHKIDTLDTEIDKYNGFRRARMNEEHDKFLVACNKPFTGTTVIKYITDMLQQSVRLCSVRNILCDIEVLADGMEVETYNFYDANRSEINKKIDELSEASSEDELKVLGSLIKTLEDKNKILSEEKAKYSSDGSALSTPALTKIKLSPAFLACENWTRKEGRRRGASDSDSGIIENKMVYEIYFDIFAKWFENDESETFINSLNTATAAFNTATDIFKNYQRLLSYALTRLVIKDDGDLKNIAMEDVDILNAVADHQIEFYEHPEVHAEISNLDEARTETRVGGGIKKPDSMMLITGGGIAKPDGMMLITGGYRNPRRTTLVSTNDRGLPYSPIVSRLSYVLFNALVDPSIFVDERKYMEQFPEETNFMEVSGQGGGSGEESTEFQDLLLLGKFMPLYTPEKQKELSALFLKKIHTENTEALENWTNFKFPNPFSGIHLQFFLLELFFDTIQHKIKDSSYLPEFLAYLFFLKRYVDELILLCRGITQENIIDRLTQIRVLGSIFNLLFIVFPHYEEGEKSISSFLSTDLSSMMSRVSSNVLLQYAGNLDLKKENIEILRQNTEIFQSSPYWKPFLHKIGSNYLSSVVHEFRKYDNSVLLLYAGSIDFSKIHSIEEIHKQVAAFDQVYKLQNTGAQKLSPKEQFLKSQDVAFHRFILNLKKYTMNLLEWNKQDILNFPIPFLSLTSGKESSPLKQESKKKKIDMTPPRETMKRKLDSVGNSLLRNSVKRERIQTSTDLTVSGGKTKNRKTRRNRK
jgi:hypothetical protein